MRYRRYMLGAVIFITAVLLMEFFMRWIYGMLQ
jgi:hypothetical protein